MKQNFRPLPVEGFPGSFTPVWRKKKLYLKRRQKLDQFISE